jgi:hypothetical protein
MTAIGSDGMPTATIRWLGLSTIQCWPVRLWFCSAFKAEVRHGIDLSIVRDLLLAAQAPSPRSTLWLQFCAGITERKRDPFFPATSM